MKKEALDKLISDNPISPELKDKFKVVGVVPGPIKFQGVQYDLRKMDVATAEKLAANEKFTYLVKIQKR